MVTDSPGTRNTDHSLGVHGRVVGEGAVHLVGGVYNGTHRCPELFPAEFSYKCFATRCQYIENTIYKKTPLQANTLKPTLGNRNRYRRLDGTFIGHQGFVTETIKIHVKLNNTNIIATVKEKIYETYGLPVFGKDSVNV